MIRATPIRKAGDPPSLIYLPDGYDRPGSTWPLIFFLHGADVVGTDLERVRRRGPPSVVERGRPLPFVVVAPQTSATAWNPTSLDRLLDEILRDFRIDPRRVHLTGYSMGGAGTWAWASARPDRFASIAPICGVADLNAIDRLRSTPVRAFHGELDRVVPHARSLAAVEKLRRLGGDATLTTYPDLGHDCWNRAYDDPALYEWFLKIKAAPGTL